MTPAGFAAAYGPTTTDYKNVTSFAATNGLTVARTFTGRKMLAVDGDRGGHRKCLLRHFERLSRADGTTFFAPANDPSLNPGPAVASIPIIGISGPGQLCAADPRRGDRVPHLQCSRPSGAENAFYGPDFANAYFPTCAPLMGQGQNQTVALFEEDSYLASDILAFTQGTLLGEAALNVPANLTNVTQKVAPSSTSIPFGTATFPPKGGNGNDNSEVALDMSMVIGVAPQANLIVYEDNSHSQPFDAVLGQIADEDLAQTISSSWYWGFSTENEQLILQNVFYQYACQSQSFFEASMDKGAYIPNSLYNGAFASPLPNVPEPMIDSPYITVVGGTELTTSGSAANLGAYSSETTWNDTSGARTITSTVNGVLQTNVPQNSVTGGGFCTGTSPNASGGSPLKALPIPTWQIGVNSNNTEVANNPSSARMIPDVSLVASGLGNSSQRQGRVHRWHQRGCPLVGGVHRTDQPSERSWRHVLDGAGRVSEPHALWPRRGQLLQLQRHRGW